MSEMTVEQCRAEFLEHVRELARYWKNEQRTSRDEALDGLAFSFLVLLDGASGSMPAFKVIPDPHPTDKAFSKTIGDDWWPDNVDISGGLHDEFYAKEASK